MHGQMAWAWQRRLAMAWPWIGFFLTPCSSSSDLRIPGFPTAALNRHQLPAAALTYVQVLR